MQTVCPICHTIFRIAATTLTESDGMVQCGVCGMVFNAHEHWVETTVAHEPTATIANAAEPALITEDLSSNAENIEAAESAEANLAAISESVSTPSEQAVHTEITNSLVSAPDLAERPLQQMDLPPDTMEFKNFNQRKHSILFTGLSITLTLLLLMQLAYLYRNHLASQLPQIKPGLVRLCNTFGCTISLPHNIDALKINNTELTIDPKIPSLMQVRLGLENLSNTPVAYPAIALALTNQADEIVVRRNFQPQDYLGSSTPGVSGIAPSDEVSVNLTIKINALKVSNYKVLLFYPQ
ncbi:MAG: zinc-ribbon and DUF3426 domain-containing protein [Sulfuriferula sp.]